MALNPNKWTTKVQEAFTETVELARTNGNIQVNGLPEPPEGLRISHVDVVVRLVKA